MGKPFPSLVQLLSVLPPQSSTLLPKPSADLMGEESPLFKFYPRIFTSDPNGKRQSWEAIVQIPFIESERLMEVVSTIDAEKDLTPAERLRNAPGQQTVYDPKVIRTKQTSTN
jgi:5'-3' exoribonuclease 1